MTNSYQPFLGKNLSKSQELSCENIIIPTNIDLDSLHHDPYKSRTKHNINIMIAASCFPFRANLHMATTRFGKRATPKP